MQGRWGGCLGWGSGIMVSAWGVGDVVGTGYDDGTLECSEWMLVALFIFCFGARCW